MSDRKLDIVTARAVHLAMGPDFERRSAALELLALSDGNAAVLSAALVLVDHALTERWSTVASRARDALCTAIELAASPPLPLAG
jgi:hypothetical protein